MWILLALSAAIIWAIDYLLAEKVLLKISPLSFIAIEMTVAALVFLVFALPQNLRTDLTVLSTESKTFLFLAGSTIAFILGNILIVTAIRNSNATWAGLIEISYPIFIIFLGWIFFREHHINLGIILGGTLIFMGIFTIYFFGQNK